MACIGITAFVESQRTGQRAPLSIVREWPVRVMPRAVIYHVVADGSQEYRQTSFISLRLALLHLAGAACFTSGRFVEILHHSTVFQQRSCS